MEYASFLFLVSFCAGFVINYIASHHRSPIYHRLPKIRISIIQLSPNLKIRIGKKEFHLHHWIYWSFILGVSFTWEVGVLNAVYTKGFLVGGILQGFTYKDWKKIVSNS